MLSSHDPFVRCMSSCIYGICKRCLFYVWSKSPYNKSSRPKKYHHKTSIIIIVIIHPIFFFFLTPLKSGGRGSPVPSFFSYSVYTLCDVLLRSIGLIYILCPTVISHNLHPSEKRTNSSGRGTGTIFHLLFG